MHLTSVIGQYAYKEFNGRIQYQNQKEPAWRKTPTHHYTLIQANNNTAIVGLRDTLRPNDLYISSLCVSQQKDHQCNKMNSPVTSGMFNNYMFNLLHIPISSDSR